MSTDTAAPLEIGPMDARASVIWLHGLGADGYDFQPLAEQLGLAECTRFVLPHAPHQPVTINGGATMRAWYDVFGAELVAQEDEAGIRRSGEYLHTLIDRERQRGMPADHIAVGGFSQGGVMALYAGLRYAHRLAGLVALSAYLALADDLPAQQARANAGLGIFMGHGTYDRLIPVSHGRSAATQLMESGYEVAWHEYDMDHAVCAPELTDLRDWLTPRLDEDPRKP